MTLVDLIIAVIFVISIIVGLMRGFIREALSIASWILALWLALTFSTAAGEFIANYVTIPAEGFRTGAGFALVFIGSLFLFSIVSYLLTKFLVNAAIKGTDRVLGIGFGVVRAGAIVVALILVLRGMGMEHSEWWQQSIAIGWLEPSANYVEQWLPEQLRSTPTEQDGELPPDEAAPVSPQLDSLQTDNAAGA
ncbi:MAG: CvpA family protein [Gammaproteobacteria bacterium]|nr:CvpA family protein [Gammaproteobacteria bacterium]